MDGKHLNKLSKKAIDKIESWINIDNKDEYFDLHLDDIDSKFLNSKLWINSGIDCLIEANRQLKNENFEVILAIELKTGAEIIGITFSNKIELDNELSYSPPSLYILNKYSDIWKDTLNESIKLELNGLLDFKIYYRENRREDGDYIRVLYVLI